MSTKNYKSFEEWRELGFYVRKGEHAKKYSSRWFGIPLFHKSQVEEDDEVYDLDYDLYGVWD
jgi:hypothetical protein